MSRHAAPVRGPRPDITTSPTTPIRRSPPAAHREHWGVSGFGTQLWVLALRSIRTAFGHYRLIFLGILQPVVIMLLFSQAFAGVSELPGVASYGSYINYLLPATLVTIAVITAMSSGAALMFEITSGFVGRLRTMPISLFAVLLARSISDTLRLVVQLAAAMVVAVLVLDFRSTSWVASVAACALTAAVGWGMSWVFIAIATWRPSQEVMQAASFVVIFPLMFTTSAYMPVESMPGWMEAVATVNPLTYAIDAVRALTVGDPYGTDLAAALALLCCAALIGILTAAHGIRRTR
ncbi:ABC-2 type transport system permease protein [Haloechinothrix alba]|uniref:Transport permease protein n=1 Tax=Haloechinothrix alba TaxID=664784 RepID=A0A238VHB4_9PSEU|nr:ABC transporter permease [Haloechinothrix alba]SNR33073.1 ABC-2 type transport system permease protein [Haloechinothrix alba]